MAQALHHEHIVRINDPANIAGAWLTREQLWAGLQHTVLAPEVLDESIDATSIERIVPGRLRRPPDRPRTQRDQRRGRAGAERSAAHPRRRDRRIRGEHADDSYRGARA